MGKKRVAEIYHQETKYAEHEMGKHERRLDMSQQPEIIRRRTTVTEVKKDAHWPEATLSAAPRLF
jgi:hypothetical protein